MISIHLSCKLIIPINSVIISDGRILHGSINVSSCLLVETLFVSPLSFHPIGATVIKEAQAKTAQKVAPMKTIQVWSTGMTDAAPLTSLKGATPDP